MERNGGRACEHFPVVDMGDEMDQSGSAFMDTAAIMMNLDSVITLDTAVGIWRALCGSRVGSVAFRCRIRNIDR